MGYITEDYYLNTYHGEETSDDLSVLIERASDVIDNVTGGKIGDITAQPTVIADLIQKATAAQVEFMDYNGGLSCGNDSGVSSCTIGKFSYSTGSNSSGTTSDKSPVMMQYLERAGLLYRG